MQTLRDQFETAITDNPTGACKVWLEPGDGRSATPQISLFVIGERARILQEAMFRESIEPLCD